MSLSTDALPIADLDLDGAGYAPGTNPSNAPTGGDDPAAQEASAAPAPVSHEAAPAPASPHDSGSVLSGGRLVEAAAAADFLTVSSGNGAEGYVSIHAASTGAISTGPLSSTSASAGAKSGASDMAPGGLETDSYNGTWFLLSNNSSHASAPYSGNQDIDAVLFGSKWGQTITYSFPTAANQYQAGYGTTPAGSGFDTNDNYFVAFNAAQVNAALYALGLIGSFTGVNFVGITETTTTHATLRFAQTDDPSLGSAHAWFPSGMNQSGDVWMGRATSQPYYLTPAVGNWGQATIMHELGHAMGLKHGHTDNTFSDVRFYLWPTGPTPIYGSGALPAAHDGQSWSLMTYRSDPGNTIQFEGEGFNQPQTYMQDDIAALQYLYGANYGYLSGDTVYTFSTTTGEMFENGVGFGAPTGNVIYRTVWDGGGNDTYDLSNYSTNLTLDLRPGNFSNFGMQLANNRAYSGGVNYAPGNVANALLYQGNIASLIENAIGGSGNDLLIGNDVANVLSGNGGNDVLYGGNGLDSLYGGGGDDYMRYVSGEGYDNYYGGTGNDTVVIDTFFSDTVQVNLDAARWGYNGLAFAYDISSVETVFTGDNNDTITGTYATQNLYGGGGDDTFISLIGRFYDNVYGGLGTDTLDHSGSDYSGDTFDFSTSTYTGTHANSATLALSSIEIYFDGTGGNTIISDGGGHTYYGGDGDDTMIAVAGGETMYGGNGVDTVDLSVGNFSYADFNMATGLASEYPAELFLGFENAILTDNNNIITGNDANNTIFARGGNDSIDGGLGADQMYGGTGNDTFYVDNAGDKAFENVGEGSDTVYASVNHALAVGQEIEVLATTNQSGTGTLNLTGNEFAQTLQGNNGNNALNGWTGADQMFGFLGNDRYTVDSAADKVFENVGEGNDTVYASVNYSLQLGQEIELLATTNQAGTGTINLTGNEFNQRLNGNNGNNALNGWTGADQLVGYGGNDRYTVDNAADKVFEAAGQGSDTVYTSVNYSLQLGQEIELLATTNQAGTGTINLTGNEFNQRLNGNNGNNALNGWTGADQLVGYDGNDRYYVDNAGDQVFETAGQGSDTVYASVSYVLGAGQSIETLSTTNQAGTGTQNLTGNALAQRINGNDGNNALNGAGGADLLVGYGGNDRYYVDNAGDQVFEAAGKGNDAVYASVSYVLAAGQSIETLSTTNQAGVGALNLTGNDLAQTLNGNNGVNSMRGNGGDDRLNGFSGNDFLDGGLGNDILTGGADSDTFGFNTALNAVTNVDTVIDFSVADDAIQLENFIFTTLAAGALAAAAFHIGAAAADASDRIIYNNATGALSYDSDGTGAAAAVKFASLAASLAMTNADFVVT